MGKTVDAHGCELTPEEGSRMSTSKAEPSFEIVDESHQLYHKRRGPGIGAWRTKAMAGASMASCIPTLTVELFPARCAAVNF